MYIIMKNSHDESLDTTDAYVIIQNVSLRKQES